MSTTEFVSSNRAVEAADIPVPPELCRSLTAPGGCIADIGIYGNPVNRHEAALWSKNTCVATLLADSVSTSLL